MNDIARDHSWKEVSRNVESNKYLSRDTKIVVCYKCMRCDQEVSYTWDKKVGKLPKKNLTDSHPNLMSCDAGVAAKVMEG